MSSNILKIVNLKKSYHRANNIENSKINILDNLNAFIPKNKITALIGGNGAGKTTLFNIISLLIEADHGEIIFDDNDNVNILNKNNYELKKMGIGRMFQDNHIFQNMTVMDNMLIADNSEWGEFPFVTILKIKKHENIEQKRKKKVRNIFSELFGKDNAFWNHRNKLAGELSYGQQRLLGLARLFMSDYKLVLLDEPTSGVDPRNIDSIESVIRKLKKDKNTSVFMIEHNMDFVKKIADWCLLLNDGKINFPSTTEDFFGNYKVRDKYLGF